MDKKIVFVKTEKGKNEARGRSDALYGDVKRILHLVDDESTVAEITKRAPPSLRTSFEDTLQELVDGGYIRDVNIQVNEPKKKSDLKFATPGIKSSASSVDDDQSNQVSNNKDDLDFSFIAPAQKQLDTNTQSAEKTARVTAENLAQAEAKAKVEAQSKADQEAHAKKEAEVQAQAKAEVQLKDAQKVAAQAAKDKAFESAKIRAQIEVAARTKIEAEARAKKEAEAKAEKLKAEQEAMKARAESEAAKARIEAEVRARMEVEAKAKQEAEAIRKKAEQEAEKLRLELKAAKEKAEAELRSRIEAENRAKAEHEARLKREAEAERLQLEKERAELEIARFKAETDRKMREEAEVRVRAEIDARIKAEALAIEAEENKSKQNVTGGETNSSTPAIEQNDSRENIKKSFVESFGKAKKDLTTGSFKLERFSLSDTGQIKALTEQIENPKKTNVEEDKAQTEFDEIAEQLQKEQEEALRIQAQEEEAVAKAKAAHEALRVKLEREAAEVEAATEAQEMAGQQSKQWEEAQQRATRQAQAEKERLAKETAEALSKSKQKILHGRKIHKPFPVVKAVGGLFVLALLAVVGLPYVWPTDDYIPQLEAEATAQLKQPVHIKSISFALLPLPKIVLSSVTLGKAGEINAGNVILNFGFPALFSPIKPINELDFNNVVLAGASFDQLLPWLQAAGGIKKYPVAHMNFKAIQINVKDFKLPVLNGRADFDTLGKFSHANLKTEDEKLGIELEMPLAKLQIGVNLHDGSLPIFPGLVFKDLSVNGVLENGEMVLSDLLAHIYGGALTGKGRLEWSKGWTLQGQLNARNMELQQVLSGSVLSGELLGEMKISLASTTLAKLDDDPHIEGSFEAKNGEIKKIDVEAIARFGARSGVAGHTNFTEMSGTIKSDKNTRRIFLNKLATANAKTTGVIDVDSRQQLSGKLLVDFDVAGIPNIPMHLSGTPIEPDLQAGR